jgi:hypothetical protein
MSLQAAISPKSGWVSPQNRSLLIDPMRGILGSLEGEAPLYRVHLVDEATVVERGERLRVWFLPHNDTWIRAKDHPGAEQDEALSDRQDQHCPPGTIWKRQLELRLPPGTPLLSRVTTPLIEKMEALSYLMKERRGMRRHIEETWFVVVGNYRIKKSQVPDSFNDARKEYRQKAKPKAGRGA